MIHDGRRLGFLRYLPFLSGAQPSLDTPARTGGFGSAAGRYFRSLFNLQTAIQAHRKHTTRCPACAEYLDRPLYGAQQMNGLYINLASILACDGGSAGLTSSARIRVHCLFQTALIMDAMIATVGQPRFGSGTCVCYVSTRDGLGARVKIRPEAAHVLYSWPATCGIQARRPPAGRP